MTTNKNTKTCLKENELNEQTSWICGGIHFHHALRRFPNTSVHHRPPQWCTAFAFQLEARRHPKNLTESTWIPFTKTKSDSFCEFQQKNLTKKMFFHTQLLTSLWIPIIKPRPRITLMPLVMGPFLQQAAGWVVCPFFPPKNPRDILWSLKLPLFYISNGLNLYRCGKWVCLFKQNDVVAFRSQRVIWKTEAVPSFRSKLLALLGWYLWYPLQLCRYPMMSLLKLSPSNGMVESISANTHLDLSEFDS